MLIVLLVIAAIVVLVLVGGLLIGLALKLLWWTLIGLVIGALARLILPGKQAMGWLATAAAGVGGALLGGVIAHAIGVGSILQFVIALAVAVGLVALIGGTERRFA